jgi:hypothetical protein
VREKATKKAIATMTKRIGSIVQIRHDWIHNCGRPKRSIQQFSHGEAAGRIRHIGILVREFDDHTEEHRLV